MNRTARTLVRDDGVAGSNPATPTSFRTETRTTTSEVPPSFALTHIYRWDRQGRKGQSCRILARGKMNSICVEFQDGYRMITSGNAIRRIPATKEQTDGNG